jgi:nucleoside-diphosphate-sugar epimerase
VQTAKELETTIKKFVPNFQVTYKPDPKVMEFYQNFHVDVFDDSRARKEWGWESRYPNFERVVRDFIEEVRKNPERYGI